VHPPDDELRRLMTEYQNGSEDAFRELYMKTVGPIERSVRRWSDSARAGDLTQDAFLQIHRARRTYRAESPLLPWMLAIARNVALQALRTRGRRVTEEQRDDALLAAAVGSTEESVLARHDLNAALQELPDEQREALWLMEVEGFTSAEAARITGASEGAIRVRVTRARQKLRGMLATEAQS
jgi:RNA polymerase sigma-70 factor (ECF subfamily)